MAHIVHFCPRYAPAHGGVELFFQKISQALARDGQAVSVWTTDALTVQDFTARRPARVLPSRERLAGVEVRRFPVRHVPAQRYVRTIAHQLPFGDRWKAETLRWTPFVPALTSAAGAASAPVDLVHAGGLPYTSILFAARRLAERAGAPLVISPFMHVPPPGSPGRLMRRAYLSPLNLRILSRADRLFVQTELECDVLERAGLPRARLVVVGTGVDPAECTGGDGARFRRRHAIPDDAVVVGHLANKSWDKGTLDLMDAAEQLWETGASFVLVLAGAEMRSFAERWRHVRLRDRIRNLGPLSEIDRNDFLAALDVFALPSYVESFGVSLLEAALNGAAVVAYDHGGPGQIFRNTDSAMLAAAGNVDALANALRELTSNADRRRGLALGGAAVARRYLWTRVFEIVDAEYTELLEPRSSRRLGSAAAVAQYQAIKCSESAHIAQDCSRRSRS
jgi:glycosyltransferase involved in cell wall biosynthesis